MGTHQATAVAHPNIALIKYWGNRDHDLRIPSNGSLSITLDGLETRTTVAFDDQLEADNLSIDGKHAREAARMRVSQHLDRIRNLAGLNTFASVESDSNFPTGAGIASSASAFAALTLAATAACDLPLDSRELSRLARQGSGSACRSISGGFVVWHAGETDNDSYAEPIAPKDHWRISDLIAIVNPEHKHVGSSEGHLLAETSPLQNARVADAPRRLDACRQAILERDFSKLADVVEQDSNLMHAVMMTSTPPLLYWIPSTLAVMQTVVRLRTEGIQICYTIDAGPNVHCICSREQTERAKAALMGVPGVIDVLEAQPGDGAEIVD